jgi:hypothetical protein
MKRLGKWLFHGLAAISLLLCMTTAVLWIRNLRGPEAWKLGNDITVYSVRLGLGSLTVQWLRDGPAGWYVVSNPYYPSHPTESDHDFVVGYLAVGRLAAPLAGHPVGTIVLWSLKLQYWFLCLLFATTPAWAAISIIRKCRKPGVGLCAVCGYDLRATPDRCPECGSPVPLGHKPTVPASR